jgi:hypothetical protein
MMASRISTVLTSILAKRWLCESRRTKWCCGILPLCPAGAPRNSNESDGEEMQTRVRGVVRRSGHSWACEGSGGPNQLAVQRSAAQHCDCMQVFVWLGTSDERLVQDPRCYSQQLCRLETQVEAVNLPKKWSAQLAVSVETCGSNCQRHVKVGLGHRILSSRHVSLASPAHFSTLPSRQAKYRNPRSWALEGLLRRLHPHPGRCNMRESQSCQRRPLEWFAHNQLALQAHDEQT